jgi:hypothetical protein
MTASTGNVPGRIFMSYRREDTAFPAGWLYDRLVSHFGRDQVFKDIDSIELGDDFIEVITTAVGSCDVLLALIGGRWLTITGQDGRRRLDNPDDFVRLELEAALARDVRVIPILVDVAQMPRAAELPPSLAKLARRQALELSPNRFDTDTRRLLRVLDRTVAEAQEQARQEAEEAAARQRQVEQLQGQLRERAAVQDWQAVLAASRELAALDPAAADPDGLASAAGEQITRRQEAEQKARQEAEQEAEQAAARQRQIEQLQGKIRERAAAQDWDAVLAASGELAAVDPAAADPDGLASTARQQITRRSEAERRTVAAQQPADPPLTEPGELLAGTADAQAPRPQEHARVTEDLGLPGRNGQTEVSRSAGQDQPATVTEPQPPQPPPQSARRMSRRGWLITAMVTAAVVAVSIAVLVTMLPNQPNLSGWHTIATFHSPNPSGQTNTSKFTISPPGNWAMKYTYDCSSEPTGTGNFIVDEDAGNDTANSRGAVFINNLDSGRSGVWFVNNDAGQHYLQIDAFCPYTINVLQK